LALAITAYHFFAPLPMLTSLRRKSYDALFKIEYKLRRPPPALKDIALVVIDNHTLKNMPQRWPYSRATFAKVVENLKKAGAKAIAFDFVFWGQTDPEEDATLSEIMAEDKVILPCLINEQGKIEFSNLPGSSTAFYSGVVTKIQDEDGVTRRNLLYVVNEKDPKKGILSWEMQLLKAVRSVDTATLVNDVDTVLFQNNAGEQWRVPVDPSTQTFSIHFRARAIDFPRISFSNVFRGNFYPNQVKDKIVILGTLSSLFGDLHRTPIDWLPGVVLNANAFLNLYTHDFLKNVPPRVEWLAILLGVFLSGILVLWFRPRIAIFLILLEIGLILLTTYAFLTRGYLWNYTLISILVLVCPFAAKNIDLFFSGRRKKTCHGELNRG
jgi:CHASE2 domain-containing sensor protein